MALDIVDKASVTNSETNYILTDSNSQKELSKVSLNKLYPYIFKKIAENRQAFQHLLARIKEQNQDIVIDEDNLKKFLLRGGSSG